MTVGWSSAVSMRYTAPCGEEATRPMQEKDLAKARAICMELGEKFQIEVHLCCMCKRGANNCNCFARMITLIATKTPRFRKGFPFISFCSSPHVQIYSIRWTSRGRRRKKEQKIECRSQILGKIGTDIQDHKCSWYATTCTIAQKIKLCSTKVRERLSKALRSSPEAYESSSAREIRGRYICSCKHRRHLQRDTIPQANYGKDDKECIANIKALYQELVSNRL